MKQLIFGLTFIFGTAAFGQANYYSGEWMFYHNLNFYSGISAVNNPDAQKNLQANWKENNVREIKLTNRDKKNNPLRETIINLSETGSIQSVDVFENGELKDRRIVKFKNDTLIEALIHEGKKERTVIQYTYDDKGRKTGLEESKNDKTVFKSTIVYDDKGRRTEESNVSGKKKTNYSMKHIYDDEGKRIQTDYFKNGALTRTWKYDCSEEGIEESVNPKKEVVQSSYCVWKEESADGSYITYSRYLNNGRAYMTKDYSTADSVQYKRESFNHKEQLSQSLTWIENYEEQRFFNKRGKCTSYRMLALSDEGFLLTNIYSQLSGIGKFSRVVNNEHDKKGLLLRQTTLINGKSYVKEVSYSYY
jgi:hypothetical protein